MILFVYLNKHLIINVVNSKCMIKREGPSYGPYVSANGQIVTQRGYKRGDYVERFRMAYNGGLSDGQRYRVVYSERVSEWVWPTKANCLMDSLTA